MATNLSPEAINAWSPEQAQEFFAANPELFEKLTSEGETSGVPSATEQSVPQIAPQIAPQAKPEISKGRRAALAAFGPLGGEATQSDESRQYLQGMAKSAMEGGTFGWGDDAIVKATVWVLRKTGQLEGISDDDALRLGREAYDKPQEQFKKDHPYAAAAAEIAGAIASAGGGAKVLGRLATTQAPTQTLKRRALSYVPGAMAGGGVGAALSSDDRTEGFLRGAALSLPAVKTMRLFNRRPLPAGIQSRSPGFFDSAGAAGSVMALEGAVGGAGSSPPGERLEAATDGAATSLVAGPVLAGLGKIGGAVAGAVNRRFRGAGDRVESQLSRDIVDDARLRGISPQQQIADLETDPNMRLTELEGGAMEQRAREYARLRGASRIPESLAERNVQASQRALGALDDSFKEITGEGHRITLREGSENAVERMRSEASPMFAKAYALFPSIPSDSHPDLMRLIETEDLVRKAFSAGQTLKRSRGGRMSTPETASLEDWHLTRQALDVDAYRGTGTTPTGQPTVNREPLINFRTTIKNALEEITKTDPDNNFAEANKIYSGEADILRALEDGGRVFSQSADAIRARLAEFNTQGEREAYRVRAFEELFGRIEGNPDEASIYRRITGNLGLRKKIRATFQNQAAYDAFMKTLEVEERFFKSFATMKKGFRNVPDDLSPGDISRFLRNLSYHNSNVKIGLLALVARKASYGEPTEEMQKKMAEFMTLSGSDAYEFAVDLLKKRKYFFDDPEQRQRFLGLMSSLTGKMSGSVAGVFGEARGRDKEEQRRTQALRDGESVVQDQLLQDTQPSLIEIPTISTSAEWDAIKSGQIYISPDGKKRRKK